MGIFSDRLRALREETGKTQQEVAGRLGITAQALSGYERGREPSYDMLCTLAKYYRVSCDYLTGNSYDRTPTSSMPVEFTSIFRHEAFKALDEESKQLVYTNARYALRSIERYFATGARGGTYPLAVAFHVWNELLHTLFHTHKEQGDCRNSLSKYHTIEEALIDVLDKVHEDKKAELQKLVVEGEENAGNDREARQE